MATARSRKQEGVPDSCSKIKGNCGFRGRGGISFLPNACQWKCPRTLSPAPATHPPTPPAALSWSSKGSRCLTVAGGLVPSGCWRTLARLWGPGLRWWRAGGGRASRRLPAGDLKFFSLTGALRAPDIFIFPWNYAIMIVISGDLTYAFSFFCPLDWLFWLSLSFSGCCGCSKRLASFCAFWLPGFCGMRGWDRSLGSVFLLWVPLPAGFFGRVWAFWVWALGLCPSIDRLRSIGCRRRSRLAGGPAFLSDLPSWSLPGAAILWGRLRFLGVRSLCSWLRAARSYLAAWLGSPCLVWDRMGALGFFLVAGASPSPPGSVISFLVFLYYARLFPPGICLIIPWNYAIIKEWNSIGASLMTYRCTRINPYPEETPITDRQGYYLKANSAKEAIEWMGRRFPGEEFIIEIWQ
jgi:hypothetical protein